MRRASTWEHEGDHCYCRTIRRGHGIFFRTCCLCGNEQRVY